MATITKFANLPSNLRTLVLFSTSIAVSTPSSPSFADYLVDSLGFSHQQSLSTSTRLAKFWQTRGIQRVSDFKFSDNASSVINFFKQHGFDETQIRKLVISNPRILAANIVKTLEPKFKALQDLGFSGSAVVELVSHNADLLSYVSESSVAPIIQALRQVLGCDDHVILVLQKLRRGEFWWITKALIPNVALLEGYEIPIELIRKQIIQKPQPYLCSTESFKDIVMKVEEKLGISRHSKMFLRGIFVLTCLSDKNIDSKCDAFKSFGWTESDIKALIKRNPLCLGISVDKIKRNLNFLMKELGYEPAYLAAHPPLLSCSLDKRIMPRHRILLVLKEKGLIRMDYPLYNAICLVESRFLKQFVMPFEEVHEVYMKLTGLALRPPTEGSTEGNL